MASQPKTDIVDVLIVDDDLQLRQGLRETLEDSGFVCHVEEDGLRAFDWLRDIGNTCRVILLDMATPRINGWQFLELRAKSPKISSVPVIVFSAMPLDRLRGLDVAEIVRKPANPARLLSAIRRSLD
jgi:two-component system response regulator ResD